MDNLHNRYSMTAELFNNAKLSTRRFERKVNLSQQLPT